MTNGEDNADVLRAECDSAITDIRDTPGMKSCDAHQAISRGLIVLLRCQSAQLARESATARTAAADRRALRLWLGKYGLRVLFGLAILSVGVAVGRADLLDRLRALLP